MSTTYLLYIVIAALVFVLLFFLFNTLLAVPFVPTSRKLTRKMIKAGELKKSDIVYDLGSGDGRLVIEAAKYGVKSAVGFEINPILNIYARTKSRILKLENVLFITKSLYSADLSKCTKLFIYLSPGIMRKLEKKIEEEMPEGAMVISNTFTFKNLELVKTVENKIKIYRVKKLTG